MDYYDLALKWWDGTSWQPVLPSVTDVDLVKVSATSVATTTALATSASTINNGQSVTLTATVTGAASGSVNFFQTSGTSLNSTDSASPWTATYAPTTTSKVKASYIANGIYLGSTSTEKTITVKQQSTKTYSQASRSGYSWRQSSSPTKIESTFTVGSTGNIPYTSGFTITGIQLEVAGYYLGPGSSTITAHIANSSGTILSQKTGVVVSKASSSDSALSALIDIPDLAVSTGTYRIGFTRSTSYQTQWDEYTGSGTLYWDGASQGTGSILWKITGYIWA